MKIVCSSNMPFAREAFSTLGETVVLNGREISAADVKDADILAIRSTTRVDRELLEGSRVRFVGTATIGTDHLDIDTLETSGIGWCYSPGCNANSVSEYVTAALLHLARKHGFTLAGKVLGVIGVGNVGSRVVRKALALGMNILPCDPPRQRRGEPVLTPETASPTPRFDTESNTAAADPAVKEADVRFVGLERVLAEADVVTLHVPLTDEERDATRHMVNRRFLEQLKPGCILVNAARGAVVDTDALLRGLSSGHVAHAVIDTWEGEPDYRTDLLHTVDLATPHIAGHSFEGKYIGTWMVYREACRFLGVTPTWTPQPLLPPPPVPAVRAKTESSEAESVLERIVRQVYDIRGDDRRFRDTTDRTDTERIRAFDDLRKTYPMRREFRFTRVECASASPALQQTLESLGFAK